MTYRYPNSTRTTTPEHRARRLRVFKRDGYRCQIRGARCTGHADELDHVIALAEHGPDTDENSRAACRECHREKSLAEAARGRRRQARSAWHPVEPHPGLRTA